MSLAEDLEQIESSIRRLHVEWDKFFSGTETRPPTELKAKLEALIRRHANTTTRVGPERFRYQTLAARYATFNELWNKRLRAKEEGRSIQGYRLPSPPPPPAPAPASPAAAAGERAAGAQSAYRVADPSRDLESLKGLFERFAEERMRAGAPPVKFDNFQRLVSQQTERIISAKGAQAVDFRVETKDGKVSLKARPVK